ncbi:myeloid leukemia factor [Toxorhynchites rutilus septentrionalis]|uniref:myeloid leukemia factor n=1 Tax=Toxorhynchites rutilus septentrionalis TaxID=329112 RepID=UPI00247ABCE2|nr:myeloid leukemia factor [Toxorhynchites rutilus septentrionalis]
MSLFGMMGDLEDDPIFGHHMRSMRQMNNMMNSLFADPFGMFGGGLDSFAPPSLTGVRGGSALMPFMSPNMNMNRLLNNDGTSFCQSSVFSMSSGPDGPQVYQATSSTRTGPGGVKETRKSVQDSRSGTKKMAIGHHIGERAHIIEREQNVRTGTQEERQDFINLDDEEAEEFDREFQTKARSSMSLSGGRRSGPEIMELPSNQPNPPHIRAIANTPYNEPSGSSGQQQYSPSPSSSANRNRITGGPVAASITPRRPIRTPASSPLAMPPTTGGGHITTSVHPHPYNMSGRKNRAIKGPSSSPYHQ